MFRFGAPDRNGLLCSAPASGVRCLNSEGAGSCARVGCGAERLICPRHAPCIAAVMGLDSRAAAISYEPLLASIRSCTLNVEIM